MLPVLIWASGLFLFLGSLNVFGHSGERNHEGVQVFASVTLTDVLLEIARDYERDTGHKVRLNFTGADMLLQQMQLGVPADLVIPADQKTMDVLVNKKLIRADTLSPLVRSRLVMIVNKESPVIIKKAEDLLSPKVNRIAMANPQAIPSGRRSKEYLEHKKLWKTLEPRIYTAANARGTLASIEMDIACVGFVYKTDALISRKVKIAYEIPVTDIPEVSFPMALTSGTVHTEEALAFREYLMGPAAKSIFKRYGFIVP